MAITRKYTFQDGAVAYAQQVNEELDQLITAINSLDASNTHLSSTADGDSGADQIGVTGITGVSGDRVQAVLEALAVLIAGVYTKAQTDGFLLLKENVSDANLLLKTVAFDSTTGSFTFTTQGGTTTTINTDLEKIPASMEIVESGSTYKLRITNQDGSYTECDVSELFNATTFTDSSTIDFTETTQPDGSKSVTAGVKLGSINDTHLTSEYKASLQILVTEAETAQVAAEAAESNAIAAKNSAETAKSDAITAKNEADTAKTDAITAKNAAQTSETNASTSASNASTSASNAEGSAEDAEAWAIGKRNGADVPPTDPTYNNNAKYWKDRAQAQAGDKLPIAGGTLTGALTLAGDPTANLEAATKQYVDAVNQDLTGSLTTTWVGTEAPYTQAVTVTGILATDKPIIDLIAADTFATAEAENEAWCKIYRAVTSENTITFYATEAPTVAMNFSCKVVR